MPRRGTLNTGNAHTRNYKDPHGSCRSHHSWYQVIKADGKLMNIEICKNPKQLEDLARLFGWTLIFKGEWSRYDREKDGPVGEA